MQETLYGSIFTYIKSMENMYAKPIQVNGKNWNMKDHITRSALYKNSDIVGTKDDYTPIKNITRPILNLQYRTEDIDVKDVQLYVDDKDKYHLSFLVKKYHDDVFVLENDLDTLFDDLNQARIDFGCALSKRVQSGRENVPLQSIAFCDQTDILSGPIGIKHYFSPDQLLDMASRGWGETANGATVSLQELITLSREDKKDDKQGTLAETPGRYIEIYEVHGNLPKRFANEADNSGAYETRLWIVAFYQKSNSMQRDGVILYTQPETESPFKLAKRGDAVFGRALDFGGAEELFEAQVWVNYDMIRKLAMIDAASKTIILSEDPSFTQKNKVRDMHNLQVADVTPGMKVYQMDTFPRNLKLFDDSVNEWEAHAQQMGAANDSIMGENPSAGTPFKLQELVTSEAHGLHDYRRGKFAKHLEEIYRDDYIPMIEKKICEGMTWLSTLSIEEMQYLSDCVVESETAKMAKTMVLSGQEVTPEQVDLFKTMVRDAFHKKGDKHFLEVLKGEFKDSPLAVKVNIAGKQKNLAARVDKLTNIIRFAFSTYNPQTGTFGLFDDERMASLTNQVLEASGLDPIQTYLKPKSAAPDPASAVAGPPQPQLSPIQNPQAAPAMAQ